MLWSTDVHELLYTIVLENVSKLFCLESPGYSLVSKLRPNITNVYVLERLVRLQVSNLHHEWMRAIVLAIDIELGHDNSKIGSSS